MAARSRGDGPAGADARRQPLAGRRRLRAVRAARCAACGRCSNSSTASSRASIAGRVGQRGEQRCRAAAGRPSASRCGRCTESSEPSRWPSRRVRVSSRLRRVTSSSAGAASARYGRESADVGEARLQRLLQVDEQAPAAVRHGWSSSKPKPASVVTWKCVVAGRRARSAGRRSSRAGP